MVISIDGTQKPFGRGRVEYNSNLINDGYLDDSLHVGQASNVIRLLSSLDLKNPLPDILAIIRNISNPNRVSKRFGVDIYMELLEFLQQT